MRTALIILFVAGPVGALDVVYFHIWKFRLYRRAQSRREEVTHLIRGIMVPAIFGALLAGRPEGTLFLAVAATFLLDTLNSLIDVMVEPRSRASLGGVPPAELAVHFIGTSLMSAAFVTFLLDGWRSRHAAAALVRWPAGALPWWFITMARGALLTAAFLVIFEAALAWRWRARATQTSTPQ